MIKINTVSGISMAIFFVLAVNLASAQGENPIPDTGQTSCYNSSRAVACSKSGQAFYGQDAQYENDAPAYRDNGDGTVTDITTGLMWSKTVDKNKVSLNEAKKIAQGMTLAGHSDWRVPDIKELYSLIDFRGYTGFST